MLKVEQPRVQPVYLQSKANEAIDLGTLPVDFCSNGNTFHAQAKVQMRFVPRRRLELTVGSDGISPEPDDIGFYLGSDNKVAIPVPSGDVECLCVNTQYSSTHESVFTLSPRSKVITITPTTNAISHAVFHIFNFPVFLGPDDYISCTGQPPVPSLKCCSRVYLIYDNWKITIAAMENTALCDKELETSGGYLITHVGKIEREDGSVFSSDQLVDILHCLHYFLSFALGRWAGVALPIGFNKNGEKVFEQWGLPMVAGDHWGGSLSWFDVQHSQALKEVFPGFYTKWNDTLWQTPLKTVLYWYLAANERSTGIGVDAGVILAQTALECLAWNYCVEDHKMVSKSAFEQRGLSASGKIRLLATALEIPVVMPSTMTALTTNCNPKCKDIPDAITFVRNSLVHPSRSASLLTASYFEAWQAAEWLLEMSLLHLCGYNGEYANRLSLNRWEGVVESVPWVKETLG